MVPSPSDVLLLSHWCVLYARVGPKVSNIGMGSKIGPHRFHWKSRKSVKPIKNRSKFEFQNQEQQKLAITVNRSVIPIYWSVGKPVDQLWTKKLPKYLFFDFFHEVLASPCCSITSLYTSTIVACKVRTRILPMLSNLVGTLVFHHLYHCKWQL
jgi:hypothetical protein